MKRLSVIIVALLLSAVAMDAMAQQVVKKRIGVYKEGGEMVVEEATTTLVVDITVECETFTAGPYARYAQKLLGKRASYVNRADYTITAASVAVLEGDAYYATEPRDVTTAATPIVEMPLQIDRTSSVERSLEEAAKEAAELIFELRRARIDLITGELGEGVYGGGLDSALAEISRLEQGYLDLFYGQSSQSAYSRRVVIPVNENSMTYLVARFSEEKGIVADDDLTGDIIMLAINPSKGEYPASHEKGTVPYRYANNAKVVISLGADVLTSRVLPIYEFGSTVMFANPR